MKIALGADHAGFEYKEAIKHWLEERGYEPVDFGAVSFDPEDDYPVFIQAAARAVASGECGRGIVLGGSGNGEAMAANKVKGIRCGLAWNVESARLCRQHNDANMLSLGQRMMSRELALELVRVWLETAFEGGRHARRLRQLESV